MRLEEGYFANLVGQYSRFDNEVRIVMDALRSNGKSYVIMKPSVVPVDINGVTRHVTLPPLTLITPKPLDTAYRYYRITEECWVDGKPLPSSPIDVMGAGTLRDLLDPIIQLINKRVTSVRGSKCLIVDVNSEITWNDYFGNVLHTKHIVLLPGLTNVVTEPVKGLVWHLWRVHPVLYGLKHPNTTFEAKIVRDVPEKLMVLSKPLVFLDDYVLVSEIPYNGSIIMTGLINDEEILRILALRSLLYVC